jgi:hypothetical protein
MSKEATTPLGKKMDELVETMEQNYCGRHDTRITTTNPIGAVLLYGNKENFELNHKNNPFSKGIKIFQAGVTVPVVAVMIAFPPIIPVLGTIAAAAIGAAEMVKRRFNDATKAHADLIPGAKNTLTTMIDTLEEAQRAFERDPSKAGTQLTEVLESFESFWKRENGFREDTFVKGEGLKFSKTDPMDPALEKAINSRYSKAVMSLSGANAGTDSIAREPSLGLEIQPNLGISQKRQPPENRFGR